MDALFETNGEEDPLGLWTSTPMSQDGAVSFAVGDDEAPPPSDQPVFRINFPADDAAASQALAAREQYILNLNNALENVPARLDGLVARTQERQQKSASGEVSFAVGDEEAESGPEGDLLTMLGSVEAQEKGLGGEGDVSFGIEDTASLALEQAKAGFNSLVEQISREVLNFAQVETKVANVLLASTTIGWTGDAGSAFAEGVTSPQITLHGRNLRIVTQTRGTRLRLFITIASGATKVAALLSTPTGAVLAIPAVYQYVMQIVQQVKQLQSIQSS